ncbi:hypothetical protein KI387_002459, partial [Taxus chinensis]
STKETFPKKKKSDREQIEEYLAQYDSLVVETKEGMRIVEFVYDYCKDFDHVVSLPTTMYEAELKEFQAKNKNNNVEHEKVLAKIE